MLVRNTGQYDTRVRKEATALAEAGYTVCVLAIAAQDVAGRETVGSVEYIRVRYAPWTMLRGRDAYLARRATYEAADERRRIQLAARLGAPGGRGRLGAITFRTGDVASRVVRWLRVALVALPWAGYRAAVRRLAAVTHYTDYARSVGATLESYAPDIVHAHDLNTLPVARRYARRHRVPLVYDAHEHELHRNTTWTPLKRTLALYHEARGIRAATATITVSGGIADDLCRRYRVPRPRLVLNSPSRSAPAGGAPAPLREAAGLDADDRLVVYVGKVLRGRGVETVIEALPSLPEDVHFGLLGPRAPAAEAALLARAAALGCAGRVHLLDALPPELVPAALATADAAVIPIQNVCRSYDLSMPNKLFDAVMAGVPIAVSNLTEMRRFVLEHELGTVFDERDPRAIALAIEKVMREVPPGIRDRDRLRTLQNAVAWEAQARQLAAIYGSLGPAITGRR